LLKSDEKEKGFFSHMRILWVAAKRVSPLLLLFLIPALDERAVRAQDAGPAFRVESMQAKLFMMADGTLGEYLIATGRASIVWNVGVRADADRMLVIVKVTGPPTAFESTPTLIFTALTGRRVVLRQTAKILSIVGEGKYYAAFIVPVTGCDPVRLSARIGGSKRRTMTRLINFQCGE
jgi:hypothetical protein